MKTLAQTLAFTVAAIMTIATASSFAGTETGSAKGGATDLVARSQAVRTQAVVSQAHHASMANCPACKTIATTQTVMEGKSIATKSVNRHLCGDCKTRIETTGHGKAKVDTAVHSCTQVSAISSPCCAN